MPTPTPQELLSRASGEADAFEIEEYWQAIVELRLKGWSWRKISEWMNSQGLRIDHSSVHRFATRNLAVKLACMPKKEFDSEAHDLLMENTESIEKSDDFSSAIAETNACGFHIEEFDIGERDYSNEEGLKFEASFSCSGEMIEDRPFSGDRISGTATITINLNGTLDFEVSATRDDDPEWYQEAEESPA